MAVRAEGLIASSLAPWPAPGPGARDAGGGEPAWPRPGPGPQSGRTRGSRGPVSAPGESRGPRAGRRPRGRRAALPLGSPEARPHPRLPRARAPAPGSPERGPGPGASPPEDPGASPGGVELVMSPQIALRQVGSQESSAGGLCRAGLARREAGWIVLRWARITQAGAGLRWPRPVPGSACAARKSAGFWSWRWEGYSGVVLKMWGVRVVVAVCSGGSSSFEGLLRGRPSASPGCDAGGR